MIHRTLENPRAGDRPGVLAQSKFIKILDSPHFSYSPFQTYRHSWSHGFNICSTAIRPHEFELQIFVGIQCICSCYDAWQHQNNALANGLSPAMHRHLRQKFACAPRADVDIAMRVPMLQVWRNRWRLAKKSIALPNWWYTACLPTQGAMSRWCKV